MRQVTIVGGGIAGLTAAITCAEGSARVRLLEAHELLGGRARVSDGPYRANLGPHVIYKDGPIWKWLVERDLLPAYAGLPLAGVRFRWQGKARSTPPLGALPAVLRLRGRHAPIEMGAIARRSIGAAASSWPATCSRLQVCSPRSPGRARSTPAPSRST